MKCYKYLIGVAEVLAGNVMNDSELVDEGITNIKKSYID